MLRTATLQPSRTTLAWTLGALFLLNTMNIVDRLLFSVVQELVKVDLALSDFQLGILGGPAFAVLYILAAFPIARLAERHNRVTIISIVFAVWSGMTAFCGMAGSFVQMLLGRIGVSIGESGCAPPSHSLISDYFPANRRMSAMSVYAAGGPVGALVAAIGGGWFAQQFGWRATFLLCGGIGIVLAMTFRLTMREPPRIHTEAAPGFAEALRVLLGKSSFVKVAAACGLAGLASYAIQHFMVSFLMRSHELPLATAATIMGLVLGGVGIVVTLSAGPVMDRARVRFPRIRTWLPAAGMAWAGTFYALAFTIPSTPLAIAMLVTASLGQHFYMPAMYTVAQEIAPPRMRATSAALMIAIISVFGYGIGPPVMGLASDIFSHMAMQTHGTSAAACAELATAICDTAQSDGLRLSMSLGSISYLVAAVVFALSGKTIERDIHR